MNPTVDIEYIKGGSRPADRYNRFVEVMSNLARSSTPAIFPTPSDSNDSILTLEVTTAQPAIIAPKHIDGNGWTIQVKCDVGINNPWLFYIRKNIADEKKDYHVTPEQVDSANYAMCDPKLLHGKKLLIVEDHNALTYRDDSNDRSKVYRSDAILLVNGKAMNKPILPYNTPETAMSYHVFEQDKYPVKIENLTMIRDTSSTNKFGFATVRGYDNVNFENVTVKFSDNNPQNPTSSNQNPLIGDEVFRVNECTNITFNNVSVNGTYSTNDKYGYGFSIYTATNISFRDVTGIAAWGVMGTHCVNNIFVKGGLLNRFDVHYYGKNAHLLEVTFENSVCTYKNFNRVGIFYGSLICEKCVYNSFIPLQFDVSYHIYTGFDFVLDQCTFNTCNGHIINAGVIEVPTTVKRKSLSKMCWPNVHIINPVFVNPPSQLIIFFINNNNNLSLPISYITNVTVMLTNNYSNIQCYYCCYPSSHTENRLTTQYCTGYVELRNLPSASM